MNEPIKHEMRAEQEVSLSQVNDEELFLRYRSQGDHRAFGELVRRYKRELYAYLRRYVGSASLAEDIFQATFIQLHEKRDLYAAGRRFKPWMYSIATHLAIDAMRKAGRRQAVSLDQSSAADSGTDESLVKLLEAEAPTPLAHAEEQERRAWIRQAVDNLPEHLRSVVMLVFFQGLKYEEAAEALEIPLGTVKSRIHSALRRLNTALSTVQTEQEVPAHQKPPRQGGSGEPIRQSGSAPDTGTANLASSSEPTPQSAPGSANFNTKPDSFEQVLMCMCGCHDDVSIPDQLDQKTESRILGKGDAIA